jgi:hypothetical protein
MDINDFTKINVTRYYSVRNDKKKVLKVLKKSLKKGNRYWSMEQAKKKKKKKKKKKNLGISNNPP